MILYRKNAETYRTHRGFCTMEMHYDNGKTLDIIPSAEWNVGRLERTTPVERLFGEQLWGEPLFDRDIVSVLEYYQRRHL